MKDKKKVYFYTHTYDAPHTIYYMWVDKDWSGSSLRIGYNDSYEMRSQYADKPFFSENYEDIKKIAEEEQQRLIAKEYAALIERFSKKIIEERAIECDGRYAPA